MKIKCPLCDFENGEGSKFCNNCNEPLFKQGYSEDNPYIKIEEEKVDEKEEGLVCTFIAGNKYLELN
jgi:hypothetical protein